ncbi:amidohydrolase family protein [Thalassoglobus polymorphus]|uniref:Aminodeoxyfutalosine deaminase n=1 Tax=Thalassoglobus polymorphus TaxID=2527994 RepID=A0A517QT40_9PLAN|nr:amidohydrolase family protein [Thalassoglobus polymorphus]QDT34803.1 Aminodeoxyfutalosine deaminase [Thalassoglobus polymorphus]
MRRYRARWLFPGDGPPILNATIEVRDNDIISLSIDDSDAVDLGNVALIPGLINAHTHLEFSTIPAPLQPLRDFTSWIPSVISWRQEHPDGISSAIRKGLDESISYGVTTAAEIATTDWRSDSEASSTPLNVLMFREYLGLSDEAVDFQLSSAREFLEQPGSEQVKIGLSPHSPYSLHPDLFEGLCELAEQHQVPLAMHLAESPEELELLETGGGKLAAMLQQLGVARPELFKESRRPLDYLHRLDCGVPVLVVHGNYLGQREIEFLKTRPNMSVVYCPRTHAAMQSAEHPWKELLEVGINVALGTDSRASNPDLFIWKELQFLHKRHEGIPASELLKLATINGADALQLGRVGLLKQGHIADLCVVSLQGASIENPESGLFDSQNQPAGVMKHGEWVVTPQALKILEQ